MTKLKLGIIGCGYLSNIIVDAYNNGLLKEYELVGVLGRNSKSAKELSQKGKCKLCNNIDELLELKPDYIAEAASGQAVCDYALKILSSNCNFAVLSIGAFADEEFYNKVKETAIQNNTKVHIASGAIGGFDVLRTVSLMGKVKSGIETRKGPESLKGTPLFNDQLMIDTDEKEVFDGNAKKAISLLPTKVNVAVAASLATAGAENTQVNIHSVPNMVGDDHKITAEIEGVKAVVDIYSSTSAIAGWSIVALLQNIVSPIVF